VAVIQEISQLSDRRVSDLAASLWWLDLRKRIITSVADPDMRSTLEQIAEDVEKSHGRRAIEFGSWHGDFVPWNLARLGERLYVWDWESSALSAPLGFDALHFCFQVAFVARRRSLADSADAARHGAGLALQTLGVRTHDHKLVSALHLLELFVRHEEARSSSGDQNSRFYPEIERVLNHSLAASSSLETAR
jgi:hypothetical protein